MCYTVLIWTLISPTFGNNILLQSFNWPKPVDYVPTDRINASNLSAFDKLWTSKFAFVTSLATVINYHQPQMILSHNYHFPGRKEFRQLSESTTSNKQTLYIHHYSLIRREDYQNRSVLCDAVISMLTCDRWYAAPTLTYEQFLQVTTACWFSSRSSRVLLQICISEEDDEQCN